METKGKVKSGKWQGKDRRKGPDPLTKVFQVIILVCWVLFIAAMLTVHKASPEFDMVTDRWMGFKIRKFWDKRMIETAQYLFFTLLSVSSVGLIINSTRNKRKTDHYSISVFLMIACSIVALIILYVKF